MNDDFASSGKYFVRQKGGKLQNEKTWTVMKYDIYTVRFMITHTYYLQKSSE